MRTRFHEDIDKLAAGLEAMCLRDRSAIAAATHALLDADLQQAEHAIDLCADIATAGQECEHAAVRLLALQAPVAGELRQVVTAVQIVGDLTRIGALAEHIAEIARRRHPEPAVPDSVRPILARTPAGRAAGDGRPTSSHSR
ncbi:phosphate signaling complex PhoU family protein [Nocardia gipuzkoensis]|uniref:phosphate signaling complex PhoU family protein n=1 Tax=Nocardia gipuzkoensis TaxID=2749991 RepID=UPI0015EF5905|nr:PhoU domain-containing protein [Nocardia gipuzkoensis]